MAPRCADKERTAFLKMRDMLTGKIAVGQKTTAVLISFQSLIVERGKQLIFCRSFAPIAEANSSKRPTQALRSEVQLLE